MSNAVGSGPEDAETEARLRVQGTIRGMRVVKAADMTLEQLVAMLYAHAQPQSGDSTRDTRQRELMREAAGRLEHATYLERAPWRKVVETAADHLAQLHGRLDVEKELRAALDARPALPGPNDVACVALSDDDDPLAWEGEGFDEHRLRQLRDPAVTADLESDDEPDYRCPQCNGGSVIVGVNHDLLCADCGAVFVLDENERGG